MSPFRPIGRSLPPIARCALLLFGLSSAPLLAAEEPPAEALEKRMRELEQALAELKQDGNPEASRLEEIERQVRVLAQEIEDLKLGEAASEAGKAERGLGPAASKVYGVRRGVSIGGYGEMLYENFDATQEDDTSSGKSDQLDFLRAIVYVGYKFNDRILFNSEIEFEHASTGKQGEVSVEFAYLDFLLLDRLSVRAGMVLVPVGFINELHEPPIFLGARRPFVEQELIPTTWRENGAGVYGEVGPLSYRAYLITGLAAVSGTSSGASGFSASGIRGGRSSGSRSAAEDLALVGRLDWELAPWLTLGTSAYTGDAGQGETTPGGETIEARTTLWDLHGELLWRGLEARGLYVRTSIDDAERINEAQGFVGNLSVGERQRGWYAQAGYDVLSRAKGTRQALVPYLRYESYNTQERVPAGFTADPANDVTVTTLGVSWKPILNVAVKADYSRIENEARSGVNQLDMALGFLF